jgi:hypothetical protein
MKVLVLYRPQSEHGRLIEDFINSFQSNSSSALETLNIDTREGSAMATLYDVMEYPAILVLRTDGSPQKVWQGNDLPLVDEVRSYAIA